jgi:ferritin-like metal-binding protein YciE
MFTSLLDLYRASRSCHEVLDELISEVSLSTLESCINTKLQNQHAQVNLLYHEG